MLRKVLKRIRGNDKPLFAIREENFATGIVKLTPVVKLPGFAQDWTGFTKDSFGKYHPVDLHTDHEFTLEECKEFIEGFKKQIAQADEKKLISINYREVSNG